MIASTRTRGAPRLCIFARVPRLGRVKSRLAAEIGAPAALAAHVELVEDTLRRLCALPGIVTELWLDDVPDSTCRRWAAAFGVIIRRQTAGDLGVRMHQALTASLEQAPAAVVVGTDCPLIDGGYVAAAVEVLVAAPDDAAVVLGPAADGGYGLVGVRRPAPALFRDIPWGSAGVLSATLQAADATGLEVHLQPEIWDVDTVEDWQRYRWLRGGTGP